MQIRDIVNRDIVNLTNCEQEPIHIPGSIQPHGFLLAVTENDFTVSYCSANLGDYTGVDYKSALGMSLAQVLGGKSGDDFKTYIQGDLQTASPLFISVSDKIFWCTVHRSGHVYILEAEPFTEETETLPDIYEQTRRFLAYMEQSISLQELCDAIARRTRKITGYDRVMIYRFDEEYNGEIFAESKRDDLEPFLGLHYPHTDIPVQARELYLKNLLRIIVDINYTPVPLYTIEPDKNTTLDLSLSVLRSTSPIHVQYLRNMGVGASLTISLIHKGKLWGLIACHHYSAKNITYQARIVTRLQGHFITSQIDVRQANEEYDVAKSTGEALEKMRALPLANDNTSFEAIVHNPATLHLCNATGVCILVNNVLYKGGETPADEDILTLVDDLSAHTGNTQLYSAHAAALFPWAERICDTASGVLYHSLSIKSKDCILWFRTESVNEVHWGGDPQKAIIKDENGLHPRKSFELWKQVVKCKSKRWLQPELAAAAGFAYDLQKHVNLLTLTEEEEKYRRLSEVLKEYNDELENLNWISTHDLQEPLRKIQLMVSRIMAFDQEAIPERMRDLLGRIHESAQRMQILLKDILNYTKLKYSEEVLVDIDLNDIVAGELPELNEAVQDKDARITVEDLPVVKGVTFLLKQLFSNLLRNAIKFSEKDRSQEIKVTADKIWREDVTGEKKQYHRITIADTGIGFEQKFAESIFKIFSRLHSATEYRGSGVGLAICRKIMQFHGGMISAEGTPGVGAAFYLYFPVVTD